MGKPRNPITDHAAAAPQRAAERRDHAREVAALRRENEELTKRLEALRAPRTLAPPPPPKRATIGTEDFLRVIWPDVHGMLADGPALAAALADLKALNPHQWIQLGDFLECGGFLAQHHTMGYVAQTEYSFDEDVLAGNRILDQVEAAASKAEKRIAEGNHEQRIERWCVTQALSNGRDAERLRRQNGAESVLHLATRGIKYYRMAERYDGLRLQGCFKLGKCLFIHQPSTSDPGRVAKDFGGCVVYGHTHRAQARIVRTVSAGEIGAFNPGCLCEIQPLWRHTNPTDWSHGYAVQLVAKSGTFLHINVPIVAGVSLLQPLLKERVK